MLTHDALVLYAHAVPRALLFFLPMLRSLPSLVWGRSDVGVWFLFAIAPAVLAALLFVATVSLLFWLPLSDFSLAPSCYALFFALSLAALSVPLAPCSLSESSCSRYDVRHMSLYICISYIYEIEIHHIYIYILYIYICVYIY